MECPDVAIWFSYRNKARHNATPGRAKAPPLRMEGRGLACFSNPVTYFTALKPSRAA